MNMTERWTYDDFTAAMAEYFDSQLVETDYERNLDAMEDYFTKAVLEEFAKGCFDGMDLGMCIDNALCTMPEKFKEARLIGSC
jgi:hypothetical protein